MGTLSKPSVNEILLRRKHMICAPLRDVNSYDKKVAPLVLAMSKNIESLGFSFSVKAIDHLLRYTYDEIAAFYKMLLPELKKLVAADVEYHPMYDNFPDQVIEADSIELFLNAVVHYMSLGTLLPEYEKNERLPLLDTSNLTVICVEDDDKDELLEVLANLLSSKTSLSVQDKEDVEKIIVSRADYFKALPDEVPLKENVALISKLIIEKAAIKNAEDIQKYFVTATDVLRLVVSLSNGDISLAERTQFLHLKRPARRMIMDLLAGCSGDILEDLFKYRDEWIRIAEILHVGEYRSPKYDRVVKAFKTLRNDPKPLMFTGRVEESIKLGENGVMAAAAILVKRPGEFARRLDKLLRDCNNADTILDMFESVADKVSTTVLMQVSQHFVGRAKNKAPIRVFFPKGNLAHALVEKNDLPEITPDICYRVVKICQDAIVKVFSETKDKMGKVFIDPEMRNYIVPFSQRSASSGTKMLVRGSSAYIGKKTNILRSFIWWTNEANSDDYDCYSKHGRVDIDLSACILDENFQYVSHVSYTNLREHGIGYHSGDITDGGDVNGRGVAEFIDIDINGVMEQGRYVCFQVYNYTCQHYASLPNCRFGWMEREDMSSGEIFEPSTVEMSIKLMSDSNVAIPVIFDCKERRLVWLDMNLSIDHIRMHRGGNNLESNLDGTSAVCYAMMNLNKPNLYDLITLNALARGEIVNKREDANIIFSNDTTKPMERIIENEDSDNPKIIWREKDVTIVTAFDLDYFMGQML